jgi:hypothetical protein
MRPNAAVIEKAKTVGITMAEVKAMTGWSKTVDQGCERSLSRRVSAATLLMVP